MSLIELASLFLSICILVIGASVYLRNRKQLVNKVFISFALICSLWGISYANIEQFDNLGVVRFINSFTFAISVILVYTATFFTYVFPVRKSYRSFLFALPLLFVSVVLSFTTSISGEVIRLGGDPVMYQYSAGSLSILYIFTMLYAVILIARNLFVGTRGYSTQERAQAKIIATGFVSSAIIGILIANVLPSLIGVQQVDLFAPFSLILLVGFTAYAIVKHKLFDIRLIVARSLGYILTLGTLVGVYVLTIFGLSSTVLGTGELTGVQQALYIVATLIFGFSLQPLKKFFDRLTNRLFYRDAYDAQELLDKLNKVLVGNIDLDVLLKETADLIAVTLKAEFAAFIIRETPGTSRRASFSRIVQIDTDAILGIHKNKNKGRTELIVADDIDDERDKTKDLLTTNNISIAARMVATGETTKDQGYLLLGAKQSGNPYNKQDIQVLDIIANELVIAIQNAVRFEEIETFNITLQQKVNEATKQLRQTNDKLKALDETKDEFISMASHQLRTPLTAVKGYVSMVVEGDAGKLNKQQKELLDQAFASSQRMVYLIADLLNVSRLRSGKFVIENKPTQLADVVESEMEQLTEVAKSKDQTLTYKKPDNFPALMMDETKIRQVIMNFADNALHYTQNGGHIQINLEDKGSTIEYTVVDDGLGVPKAEQHHMFTKFYRAGNAKKARPDGTGLGLFMAKKVIAAQGGAIIFKSEEGKGSTFGFIFPKAKMLAPKQSTAVKK